MNSQIELTQLTNQQLEEQAWQLKGTPEVQPIYVEMARRSAKNLVKPDDPEWGNKLKAMVERKLANSTIKKP